MGKLSSIFLVFVMLCAFAIPSKTDANIQLFIDVPTSHANYSNIMYLLENLIIEPAGRFGENDIVSREEVVVMVSKAVRLDGTPRQTKFTDVPASNPDSGFIQSAVEAGIVNGITVTTFEPSAKVTRGQMARFIARAFDLPNGTTTFKDVKSNHYAYESVKKLVAANIASGYPDGTFKPNENLTRAGASALLARAMRYAGVDYTVVTDD